jgi:hypothetical protein
MPGVLYTVPAEGPRTADTFIYILAHQNREAARKSWAGFVADPVFRAAQQKADIGGKAVAKLETMFLNPTDFSPMK